METTSTQYITDHGTYDRVTTICRVTGNNVGLLRWYAQLTAERVMETTIVDIAMMVGECDDRDAALDYLTRHFTSAPWEAMEKAGEVGTQVHDYAEVIAREGIGASSGYDYDAIEDAYSYTLGFDAFYRDYEPEFVDTERFVYSEKHGYAGRLDALVRLTIGGKRGLYVLDYKTGTERKKHAAQVTAYRRADDTHMQVTAGALLLYLHKDGTYRLRLANTGTATWHWFLDMAKVYRAERLGYAANLGSIVKKEG